MIQTYMNEEIFEKLEMSKTEVTELTLRDLRCPNCQFLIDKIYSDIQGHMQVKCPKCKNAYIIGCENSVVDDIEVGVLCSLLAMRYWGK